VHLRGRCADDLSRGRHTFRLRGRSDDLLGELVVVVPEVSAEVRLGRIEVLVEGVRLVGEQRHGAISGRVDRALFNRGVGLGVGAILREVQPSGQAARRQQTDYERQRDEG
jgi:hypothetical protein